MLENTHIVQVSKVEALSVRGLLARSGKNILDGSSLASVKVLEIKETRVGEDSQVEAIGLDPEESSDLSCLILVKTEGLEHVGLSGAFFAGVGQGRGHLLGSRFIEALIHKDGLDNKVGADKFGNGLVHACLGSV